MTTFDFSRQVVLNVTTTEDQNDGSSANGLSLRDAILQANANPSKEYVINVPAGVYNLTIQNILQPPAIDDSTPDLATLIESRKTTGDLDISGRVTIIGEDPENTIISGLGLQRTFAGANLEGESLRTVTRIFTVGDRVFDVLSGGFLTLENVTVQDGLLIENQSIFVDTDGDGRIDTLDARESIQIGNVDTIPNGAGINVSAGSRVIINNSIIANSLSEVKGGGINNDGELTINDSLIKNNRAETINNANFFTAEVKTGGGIYNTGIMRINRSSIIDNSVESSQPTDIEGAGAGIANDGAGIMTIVNTNISANDAGVDTGGGILNRGRATIVNSTIVNNIGQVGGGIYSETTGASTVITNTIVANNQVPLEQREEITSDFPVFNLTTTPLTNFADEFVWDIIDGTNRLIQPPPDVTPFRDSYYNIRVLYRNEDPFSGYPPEGLDLTGIVGLDNLIFNSDADIEFVFNRYSPSNPLINDPDNFFSEANGFLGEDNNLISNPNQNFQFAYDDGTGNTIFLNTDFEFDEEGKLILVLSDPNISNNFQENIDIFVADTQEVFTFDTFNNTITLNDENKRSASFVRDQNNQVRNFDTIVSFQNRKIAEIIKEIPNPPLPTDIDGFFGRSSAFNLIGSSSANGIVDGVNNNIVGSTTDPLDPLLEPIATLGGDIIAYQPIDDSPAINAGNNLIVELQQFFSANPVDQFGNPRINNGTVDIGSVESGYIDTQGVLTEIDSLLNTPIFRFQNQDVAGTYLYAQEQEAQQIRSRYPNFIEEGQAFKVADQQADGLIRINRFQNTDIPGTYLFATEAESVSIRQNHQNFKEEGVAFYVYGADADIGEDVYRFQSLKLPGTYLFALEGEKDSILANYSSDFRLEGVAFEVVV
ncbi:choice-of-anchor Q domain-containing protein [Cyanobacterium aponinum]|uniref:Polymorphic membrane protein Chlamydia n=1 Tax=Cyanobacterium aponinum (strain PCC 10605) TaxID=755178 RepID=K9Z158_CYAAP|nr:right-handed parallel beta-helix repeat-containing protein [Cyanobacterium aponinum]AFZ52467.1 Polymorphic membrane protein Chlamydia [Cyanobacterium aponinum PCC 10605]